MLFFELHRTHALKITFNMLLRVSTFNMIPCHARDRLHKLIDDPNSPSATHNNPAHIRKPYSPHSDDIIHSFTQRILKTINATPDARSRNLRADAKAAASAQFLQSLRCLATQQ